MLGPLQLPASPKGSPFGLLVALETRRHGRSWVGKRSFTKESQQDRGDEDQEREAFCSREEAYA